MVSRSHLPPGVGALSVLATRLMLEGICYQEIEVLLSDDSLSWDSSSTLDTELWMMAAKEKSNDSLRRLARHNDGKSQTG